uniref:Uncharacterized protein n=1 Tax=Romanomermis culicivorax TaxID=13658 RepID=A0A915HZ08_ROMCU
MAMETKTFRGQSVNETTTGIWSTNNKLDLQYKWFCSDNCQAVENLIVEQGQVASWDGNNLISTLGDLGDCKANAGHCLMADGFL